MALHFELVSPSKLLFSGDVDSVVLPGTEGEMTILPQHAPLLTALRPGIVVVASASGAQKIFVRGGFAEVNPQGLTVLAERAIPTTELDAAAMVQQVKDSEADLAAAKDDESRRIAQENLDNVKALQGAF
ncbi:MAG: F0F1 ATP synthase subunit epsilon [Aestuariivirga sp.]